MRSSKGTTRIVFPIKNYVIKIPNFTYSHQNFLQGCYANWSERQYTRNFKDLPEFYDKIAPTVFCSWFGLFSVQERAEILSRDLTDEEIEYFKQQSTDTKPGNFGYLNGKLVCVDYV